MSSTTETVCPKCGATEIKSYDHKISALPLHQVQAFLVTSVKR